MIGERLQNLRKQMNLTQDDLAEKLSISRSSLSLYEINKREPDSETFNRIADYFDVSLDFLNGRTNQPKFVSNITQVATPSLTENESELLELFRRVENERDQCKLIGRFEEIVTQVIGDFKSNDVPSTSSKKNVG